MVDWAGIRAEAVERVRQKNLAKRERERERVRQENLAKHIEVVADEILHDLRSS